MRLNSLTSLCFQTCKTRESFSSLIQKKPAGFLWFNRCSKQSELGETAQGLSWSSLKYLQECKCNNLSRKPVLIFDHLHDKTKTNPNFPFSSLCLLSHSLSCTSLRVAGSIFSLSLHHVVKIRILNLKHFSGL